MLRLALDGATEFLSVALADGENLLASATARRARGAEEFLADAAGFLLRQAGAGPGELGEIVVTTGPGSFTGVRVTMAAALGLAQGRALPLKGLDTLRAVALACPAGGGRIAAVLDARRHEVYGAILRKSPRLLEAEHEAAAESPDAFANKFDARRPVTALCGTGAHFFTPSHFPGADHYPMPFLAPALLSKKAAPRLKPLDPFAPRPDYLRAADAVARPGP